jgi:hypothetical protein
MEEQQICVFVFFVPENVHKTIKPMNLWVCELHENFLVENVKVNVE